MATQAEIQAVADRIKTVKDAHQLTFRKIQILNLLSQDNTYLQITRMLNASETHLGNCVRQMLLQFEVPVSKDANKIAKRLEERKILIDAWLLHKKQTARANA